MLNLASASDKLQVITGQAVTVSVQASWVDWTSGSTATPSRTNTAISTAATTDVVASPATSAVRNVKSVVVQNTHASSAVDITIQHTDGSTVVVLHKGTLAAGEKFELDDASGWNRFSAGGQRIVAQTAIAVDPTTNTFRLSGVSATPIMTADSTSLGTIYLAQYKGNRIALYDGTSWTIYSPSSEVSLAVTGRTTDLPFDVFAYSNAGVVTLELLDWTSATARATALVRVDGVWCKTGATTRRYLGSIRARSATTFHWVAAGTDLPCKFDLYNMDNRVGIPFTLLASTNTWNYTIATWRQAQGSTNYQLDVMVGLQESWIGANLLVSSRNATISIPRQVAIGYDSTTAITTSLVGATANTVASIESQQTAVIAHLPAIGRHFYAWLEISTATGTCTWIGDDGALRLQSGMSGTWTC